MKEISITIIGRAIFFSLEFKTLILKETSSLGDPYVFGPPGSASVSHKYGSDSGSGSGSFHHQAKEIRKTLISAVL
jgi:hypothetical protein